MRSVKRQFWLLIFFASAISRLVYMAGRTYFSAKQGTEYIFKQANTLPGIIMMAVLVAADLLANLIAKVPVIYDYFLSEKAVTASEKVSPLRLRGRVVATTLKTAAAGYGLMQVGVAYFSTSLIVKAAAELMGCTMEDLPLQKEIPLQVALIIAALLASDTYLGYDYQLIKENADTLAKKIDDNDYSTNATALVKTLLCSSLNLATYPALAYFLAKPTLNAIPGVHKYLGDAGVNIGTGIACLITLLTVVSWLPTVYKHFAPKSAGDSVAGLATGLTMDVVPSLEKRLLRGVAYPAGIGDSIAEGLALFMAVQTISMDLIAVNPYGWIIGPAALAGANGFFMNLLYSTLPGVHKLENAMDKRRALAYRDSASGDAERAPLLESAEVEPPRYANPVAASMLIFAPATVSIGVGMGINVYDDNNSNKL